MNSRFRGLVALSLLVFATAGVSAQEQLLPLNFNPALQAQPTQENAALRDALALPFIDDFSYEGTIPDPALWANRQAFVNTTFPLNPPSIGVATLDGLNETGQPYDPFAYSFSAIGGADTLMSQPLLMEAFSAADDVYFSFYYQGGGLGDAPDSYSFNNINYSVPEGDSLVLEFKNENGNWIHQWASDGIGSAQFKQAIIQVADPSFFHDDFQFRFRNIASLIGQYDCWNIDYVKLAEGRNSGDTILADVAIQYFPSSILANYTLMPWKQFQNFQEKEKAGTIALTVKNNFNIGKNTAKQMRADETTTGDFLFDSGISNDNFDPGESKVLSFGSFDIPDYAGDSIVIATSFAISATGGSGVTANDSITRNQIFYNEMAYDDGTAEAVYRLTGSPASVAQRYVVNTPDVLRAVKILFAHTEINLSSNLFNLVIWKSLEGDNDTLLRDEFKLPEFIDEVNGFAFYRLSRPVEVTDTFYIGWLQVSLQTDLKMDVGFDKNDTANQHLFYNVNGEWQPSGLPGAVMMRPLLGDEIPFGVGVPDAHAGNEISLFPNPVQNVLQIRHAPDGLVLEIIDQYGRVVKVAENETAMDVHELPPGMYLLRMKEIKTGQIAVHKFIKARLP
jgi:hypothetical protein